MRALLSLPVLFALLATPPALGVEQKTKVKIAETWAVVGVISGTDPQGADIGVAVLRNNDTKRTYTLSIGDALPNEFGFVLSSVENRTVVIANGDRQVQLGFAESAVPATANAEDESRESRTARFIDNYYRGLNDSPIEIFRGDHAEDEVVTGDPDRRDPLKLPMRRFGTFKEDAARSRFDLYRNDGGYAAGDGESEGEGGFVVNYGDGFQEEDQTVEVPTEVSLDMGKDQDANAPVSE